MDFKLLRIFLHLFFYFLFLDFCDHGVIQFLSLSLIVISWVAIFMELEHNCSVTRFICGILGYSFHMQIHTYIYSVLPTYICVVAYIHTHTLMLYILK